MNAIKTIFYLFGLYTTYFLFMLAICVAVGIMLVAIMSPLLFVMWLTMGG